MTKVINVTFPNGDKFIIPADVVARHRTNYYSILEKFSPDSDEWNDVYTASLDVSTLTDWVQNRMDWGDVYRQAWKEETPKPDYYKIWYTATFNVDSIKEPNVFS
jgi:hypothetical protein